MGKRYNRHLASILSAIGKNILKPQRGIHNGNANQNHQIPLRTHWDSYNKNSYKCWQGCEDPCSLLVGMLSGSASLERV